MRGFRCANVGCRTAHAPTDIVCRNKTSVLANGRDAPRPVAAVRRSALHPLRGKPLVLVLAVRSIIPRIGGETVRDIARTVPHLIRTFGQKLRAQDIGERSRPRRPFIAKEQAVFNEELLTGAC